MRFCALVLSILASTPRTQDTRTTFAERYALAADRAAVVATLLPGSEDWYAFTCREKQVARDYDAVPALLAEWIQRHGRTARFVETENRRRS